MTARGKGAKGRRPSLSLSADFYRRLRERCERDGIPMATLVQQVVGEALDRESPP